MNTMHENPAVARNGLPAGEGVAGWYEAVNGLFAALRARRRARRTFNALNAVDARTLKDIGIDRSEILSISYGDNDGRRRGLVYR